MSMLTMFSQGPLCNIPGFFYPTTILLVDDDPDFLKNISMELIKDYKTVTFSEANKAVEFLTHNGGAFFRGRSLANRADENILEYRREVYNAQRFQDILVSVIDFDMPDKSGFDVMQRVGLTDYNERRQHSYILLTAKRYADLNKELAKDSVGRNFISKHDPSHMAQLLEGINHLSTGIFQDVCHGLATMLTRDNQEKTSFLNDGNFLPLFNAYLKENNICEGYLFDKQGSLMLLDRKANLSWLFVRNEKGMENSIAMAKQYHAPTSVIEALESKNFILSLYEKEDFERRDTIDWDKYLLKALVFKDEGKSLDVFNHMSSDYYYSFTSDFPEHGIDKSKILSYAAFLSTK